MKYTVAAVYPDNQQKFVGFYDCEDATEAIQLARNETLDEGLLIAGVFEGEHMACDHASYAYL